MLTKESQILNLFLIPSCFPGLGSCFPNSCFKSSSRWSLHSFIHRELLSLGVFIWERNLLIRKNEILRSNPFCLTRMFVWVKFHESLGFHKMCVQVLIDPRQKDSRIEMTTEMLLPPVLNMLDILNSAFCSYWLRGIMRGAHIRVSMKLAYLLSLMLSI